MSRAGGMVAIICVVRVDRLDTLLEAAFQAVERHIGIVRVSNFEAVRAQRL